MRGLQFTIKNIYRKHYVLNAVINDLRVGLSNVNISGEMGYLNYIYVHPTFRNRRIGSALLTYTEDFLWNNNANFINLHVFSNDSKHVEDFYSKHAYNVSNVQDNAYDDGENIFDIIHMNKIRDMDNNNAIHS